MEAGTDFKFRDDLFNAKEAGSTVPIELTLDPFAGIVYRYTTVTFKMDEDNIPRLLYDYEILKSNDLSMITLRKNEKFNAALGLILNTLLLDASESEGDSGHWSSWLILRRRYRRWKSCCRRRSRPQRPRQSLPSCSGIWWAKHRAFPLRSAAWRHLSRAAPSISLFKTRRRPMSPFLASLLAARTRAACALSAKTAPSLNSLAPARFTPPATVPTCLRLRWSVGSLRGPLSPP